MIKAILFDAGDVITKFSSDTFNNFIKQRGGNIEKDKQFFKQKKSLYDQNKISTEQFWNQYIVATGVTATTKELINLIRRTIHRDEEMMTLLKNLKMHYRIILASNLDQVTYEETHKLIGKIFDAEYPSFRIGKLKSDPSFFATILREQSLTPQDTIFIDDSRNNIISASSMGIKGIIFKNHDQLVKELNQLGVSTQI
jgi:glucose-1-phosphatase